MTKKRIILGSIFVAVVVLGITLFLPMTRRTIRQMVIQEASKRLHSEVKFGSLDISIFPPQVVIKDLQSQWSQGPLRYVGVSQATIQPASGPSFLGKIAIKSIEIENPKLLIDLTGQLQMPAKRAKSFRLPTLSDLLRVDIEKFSIRNAQLEVLLPKGLSLEVGAEHFSFRTMPQGEQWVWRGTGALHRKNRTLLLDHVEIVANRDGDRFSIERIEAQGLGSSVSLKGKIYPEVDLNFTLKGDFAPVEKALLDLDVIAHTLHASGKVHVKGHGTGVWGKLNWSGNITATDVSIQEHSVSKVSIDLKIRHETVERATVEVMLGDRPVRASIKQWGLTRPGSIEVLGDQIEYASIQRLISPTSEVKLSGRVNVKVSGQILAKPFSIQGEYQGFTEHLALTLTPSMKPYLPLVFRNAAVGGPLALRGGPSLLLKEGRFKAQGAQGTYEFEINKGKQVKGTWLGNVSDLSALYSTNNPIHGIGQIVGGVQAKEGEYGVNLNIDLEQVNSASGAAELVEGELYFTNDQTEIRRLHMKAGEGELALTAQIPSHGKAAVSATFTDCDVGLVAGILGQKTFLYQQLKGVATGQIEMVPGANHGTISIQGKRIQWRGVDFDRANLNLDFEGEKTIFQKAEAEGENTSISVTGVVGAHDDSDLAIVFRKLPLSVVTPPSGVLYFVNRADGTLYLKGDAAHPEIRTDVSLFLLDNGVFTRKGRLQLEGLSSHAAFTLELGKQGFAKGRADLTKKGSFIGEGSLEQFSLSPILSQSDSHISLSWRLQGNFDSPRSWNGGAQITDIRMDKGDGFIALAKPTSIRVTKGEVELEATRLTGSSTDLDLSGRMSSSGGIVGQASGNLGLSVLTLFTPALVRAEGSASLTTRISGTINRPRYAGEMSIENALLQFQVFPQPFEDVSTKAILAEDRMIIESATGRLGEGRVTGSGSLIFPKENSFFSLDVVSQFDRVTTRVPEWLPARWSGNLALQGPVNRPILRGNVNIHEAIYRDEWDWKSRILSFSRGSKIKRAYRLEEEHLEFDILIMSEKESLFVRNNIAEAVLRGDIRLTGTDQSPIINGRVEVMSGKIQFLENSFELTSGTVSFGGDTSNRPTFDVNAKTRVQDTDIFLDVRTEQKDVVAFLSSQPARDETSLVALLTLGVDLESLSASGTSGQAVSQAVLPSVLAGPFQSRVETGLKRSKLVDSFQFVPYFSENTKTTGLKMVVGKRVFPRFNLEYSTDLFDFAGENTFKAGQIINDNVTLQGSVRDNLDQSNQEMDLGVDVEFKFEF